MRRLITQRLTVACLVSAALALSSAKAEAQSADSLNAKERSILSAVDRNNPRALLLLERIVNINSGTMNFAGVRQVGDVLRAQLDALGFHTRWVTGASFNRAGHLVAEHPGSGPKILLIGHLDTVFEPRSPFQKFKRFDDSTATGPGIIDMKGGDVILLHALRALKEVGELDKMNISVVFDGDEEHAGLPLSESRRALKDAAKGAAVAIGFEDGAGDPRTLVIARRGDIGWRVKSTGMAAHSSLIFSDKVGAGAIFESARVLNEFYDKLSREKYLTFNPGVAVGGTMVSLDTSGSSGAADGKTNVVSSQMEVSGDLRTLSPKQLAHAMEVMHDIVAHWLPNTSSEITFEDGYPPMAPTDGNKTLLSWYDRVSRDIGTGAVAAVDPSRAGAADVSFVANDVPMIVDAAGLSGHDDHTDRETADLRMLPVQTKRAAVLLSRLARLLEAQAQAKATSQETRPEQ
jgi:glutamate carboxypeptidase